MFINFLLYISLFLLVINNLNFSIVRITGGHDAEEEAAMFAANTLGHIDEKMRESQINKLR